MTVFRFAIDERSFRLAGLQAADVAPAIRALIGLVRELISTGHGVCFDPDMFNLPVWGGLTFYELFSAEEIDLSVDDEIEATTYFSPLLRWDEVGGAMPSTLDLTVANGPVETSGTIAWAHAQAPMKLRSAACIACSATRPLGLNDVTLAAGGKERVWFVDDMSGVQAYFRGLLSIHATAPSDFADLAPDAFPALDFVSNSFGGIKNMSRGLPQIAPDLVRHLAALSDHGEEVFRGAWINAPAAFGANGVNLSDENGKTKQNKVAKRERTKMISGKEISFWWHSKIEADRDRIHFNPDAVPGGGRILIGIFCRHLTN